MMLVTEDIGTAVWARRSLGSCMGLWRRAGRTLLHMTKVSTTSWSWSWRAAIPLGVIEPLTCSAVRRSPGAAGEAVEP